MSIKTAKKNKNTLVKDSWSINYAFARWVVPRLDLLIKRDFGHPCTLTHDEWKNILNTMRDGFYQYQMVGCFPSQEELEKTNAALQLFKEYFYSLWD